jgi:hypothetical protein
MGDAWQLALLMDGWVLIMMQGLVLVLVAAAHTLAALVDWPSQPWPVAAPSLGRVVSASSLLTAPSS